jgi:hypothetical protein
MAYYAYCFDSECGWRSPEYDNRDAASEAVHSHRDETGHEAAVAKDEE